MAKNQQVNNEFAIEDDDEMVSVPGSNPIPTGGQALTLDDFEGVGFDDEADEQDLKAIYPPAGDWEKEDEWTIKTTINENDRLPGDMNPAGRTYFTLYGRPKNRVDRNGNEQKAPFLQVKLSPDRRFSQNDPTRPDNSRKLYVKAKEMYTAMVGEKPDDVKKFCMFLAAENYLVTTRNFDNGPFVLDIKVKRAKK